MKKMKKRGVSSILAISAVIVLLILIIAGIVAYMNLRLKEEKKKAESRLPAPVEKAGPSELDLYNYRLCQAKASGEKELCMDQRLGSNLQKSCIFQTEMYLNMSQKLMAGNGTIAAATGNASINYSNPTMMAITKEDESYCKEDIRCRDAVNIIRAIKTNDKELCKRISINQTSIICSALASKDKGECERLIQ